MARMITLAILLAICQLHSSAQTRDTSFNGSLRLIQNLYNELSAYYVVPLNRTVLAENALTGMASKLDSWTAFLPKKYVDLKDALLSKKFGGIGIGFRQVDNLVVVSQVTKGSPAEKAGLQTGDILLSANGVTLKGMNSDDVKSNLRGEEGSKLTLSYKRGSNPSPITSVLTRGIVKVSSVPYFGMLDEHIGYIYLNGMTTGCSQDVRAALLELKKNPGLRGLILDIRDNGGGHSVEADNVANIFIPKATMTKSMKGRAYNETHYTQFEPVDLTIPVALLIGKNTASAAEIVSGILQDYDRAVLIGEQTYGKAMMQKFCDLGDGNEAMITVAHYYTPSGRCIQAKSFHDAVAINPADTVIKIFKTKNGRPVKSNTAIIPDIAIEQRILPWLAAAAYDTQQFFKFALQYRAAHPSIASTSSFRLPDDEFETFYQSVLKGNYKYITTADKKLDEWKQIAITTGEWKETEAAYLSLKRSIDASRQKELEFRKPEVRSWLEREICAMYHGSAGYIQASIKDDPVVLKAKEVLADGNLYKTVLKMR